jgi:hypothetical protein
VAFIKPEKMELARSYGLTNFSGFVNRQVDEFIKQERANVKQGCSPNDADCGYCNDVKDCEKVT